MINYASVLAWAKYFATEYGPILVAVNAIWSILRKVRALFTGTVFRKERD